MFQIVPLLAPVNGTGEMGFVAGANWSENPIGTSPPAYRGPVLPESTAPGVEEIRGTVRAALREAMLTEASIDVLLAYAEIPEGAEDEEVLRLCLEMLPARSPRRAGLVARIERLQNE